jgi:hypothetical protein
VCLHIDWWFVSFCEEMATPSSSTPATSASTLPSSSFMNWFWDLASDDQTKRLYAGTMIIKHITSSTPASASESLSTDGEYALKRLIRGISSSRDSARQGFSACLCQLYIAFPGIEMNKIISLIEESTKVVLQVLYLFHHLISLLLFDSQLDQ